MNDAAQPAADLPSTWPRRPLVLVLAGALLLGWIAALMLMAWREGV